MKHSFFNNTKNHTMNTNTNYAAAEYAAAKRYHAMKIRQRRIKSTPFADIIINLFFVAVAVAVAVAMFSTLPDVITKHISGI